MKKKNKVYDKVKILLENNPSLRDSDKKLMWTFWMNEHKASLGYMDYDDFMTATLPENIRRARQMVGNDFPQLQAINETVRKLRRLKALEKGTFIYRETSYNLSPQGQESFL